MLFLWWICEWPLPSAILSNDAALLYHGPRLQILCMMQDV